MDIFGEHYALHQNCIDCHADHHEETLKAQRDQITDVVVTGLSPFPVKLLQIRHVEQEGFS